MNKFVITLICASMFLTGCTSYTKLGPCVGVMDQKNPNFEYGYSFINVFWAIILSETLVVPAVVILKDLQCPEVKLQ